MTAALSSSDPHCPAYPAERRELDRNAVNSERLFYPRTSSKARRPVRHAVGIANFIDFHVLRKMAADGIEPAPLTSDTEFLRRVTIDLTGRIPTPEQVENFLRDENPVKRAAWIESLMRSEAFVDQWTLFFGNLFEVGSTYYNFIGIPGRNLFHQYLREFVSLDRSYRDVVGELITGSGDSHQNGPANFMVRGFQPGDPIQDTWDGITDRITTRFLGVKTECVSCHDGANHLENINLYLAARKRQEFFKQSAFFSRMSLTLLPLDSFNQQMHAIIRDRASGGYFGAVNPNNPGPRPPREGGPYQPAYMFTGERPRNGEWRGELARILGADRQFARATVNYIWAHFFSVGIVDPPDGWDLARIDPKNPPPAPATLQPTHPELLEDLADEFIRSNYSIWHIISLITTSSSYQLSSRYPGEWKVAYERYLAKHIPRRLSAEEIYDVMATATLTETPMEVDGFDRPLFYANQLPDPSEPRGDRNDGNIGRFLANFGRGNWFELARNERTSVVQLLFLMNDMSVNFRSFGNRDNRGSTRVAILTHSALSDEDAVKQLFLATLTRYPSEQELSVALSKKKEDREQWLSDIQWALLNKLDFIFNY